MASSKDVTDGVLDAWRARNYDKVASFYAQNAELVGPGGMLVRGPSGAREYVRRWGEAFPDHQLTIHKSYEAGSVVVEEGTFAGTHTGNLQTPTGVVIPPTGRSVNVRFCEVFLVEKDRVVRDRLYFDQVELLAQLGMMPNAG